MRKFRQVAQGPRRYASYKREKQSFSTKGRYKMRKTKLLIFTLVVVWLALYTAITITHTVTIITPTAVSGVSTQEDTHSPMLALIEQRFQPGVALEPAYLPQQAVPIPVTGGAAGGAWAGWLVLFSAVALVGFFGWLLVQRA